MVIAIEPVTIELLPILQCIARKSFFDAFEAFNTKEDMEGYLNNQLSIKQLTLEFNNLNSQFYMAKIDQEFVGYIKLNWGTAQSEFQEGNLLEIERLYILQQYHRQKVGQSLYNHAISVACKKAVDFIWLGVWEHNRKAIAFYKKNGFVAFDKHAFILGKDIQTDILMRKDIRNFSK